ncbi:hypothetical protein [Skermania piniformis]|uniref:Uncharacterized protein n=1 Tax=Skermania pinensis TaxID=39122 RepID=A0ABX8SDL5_9ACTN|nr:hypothetical protein [Skermania piniformis]QXQ15032.1 hypothetical protein KV203_06665 [Skermania piniformis]
MVVRPVTTTTATKTLSGIYPVRYRADLPRRVADEYWAGPHAELVKRGGHILEYNQYHFAETDHGYWPATPTVGTHPAEMFRWNGVTEVRLRNYPEMARAAYGMLGTIFHDEQNVFDNVLGHVCGPGGGSWWTVGHDPSVGHRTVLLLRRRRGVRRRRFHTFVHNAFGPVLAAAGALDTRAYTFLPFTGIAHRTPGLAHSYPPGHRHDGAIIFGLPHRNDVAGLLSDPAVDDIVAQQAQTLTAVHAYSVARTVSVIDQVGR